MGSLCPVVVLLLTILNIKYDAYVCLCVCVCVCVLALPSHYANRISSASLYIVICVLSGRTVLFHTIS